MICSWSSVGAWSQAQVLKRQVQLAQESSCPPCSAVPGPPVAQGPDTGARAGHRVRRQS